MYVKVTFNHLHHHRIRCHSTVLYYVLTGLSRAKSNGTRRCSAVRRLSSPRSSDVVLGERVLRMLISCPECHRIPLTCSVFMFGTIEDTPNIIRTGCKPSRCVCHFSHICIRGWYYTTICFIIIKSQLIIYDANFDQSKNQMQKKDIKAVL